MSSYSKMMDRYREIILVESTTRLLDWDTETHMPPQGLALRSCQLGLLKRISHRMLVSDEFGNLLKKAESERTTLGEVEQRNLCLLRRERDIQTSVPEDLVADLASQATVARDAWFRAKIARRWSLFEPELSKLLELSVERAEATMHARCVQTVYDAMIDDSDRGLTQGQVAELLTSLRESLLPLVRKCQDASQDVDRTFMTRHIPIQTQREIVRDVTAMIGYDSDSDKAWGRVDHTEHPFTSGYRDDVRITVHFREDDMFDSLFGGLHEGGHGLYDHNLNPDWAYQPVGEAVSGGMHEAMSRFPENIIGRSRAFWAYYLPKLKAMTGDAFRDIDLEQIMRAVNKVEPSKIRVKADEVTYSLHIVIRSEIERMLFREEIEVSELPHVWNELYRKYLQVEIDNDAEGVLQDVHWSVGMYGGFQSYALGNVYDGMLLRKISEQTDDWQEELERGNPAIAMEWLKANVQRWGSLYDAGELMERVTGSALTVEPYVSYLNEKHAMLWG